MLLAGSMSAEAQQAKQLSIATGGTGGVYYPLAGGFGNDTYRVDNAFDVVIEAAGGGHDRVWTSVSYALSAGSEIELLATTNASGTTAINLTGNALTISNNDSNSATANKFDTGASITINTKKGGMFIYNATAQRWHSCGQ
jgi:Ca2+-binding RTX toxin-like protein